VDRRRFLLTSLAVVAAPLAAGAQPAGKVHRIADRFFLFNRQRIMDFAIKQRLPGVYAYRELVEAGGLMSFGPSYPGMHRRAATYVDKVLKGVDPADLPVERPTNNVRLGHQHEDREDPGPHDPAVASAAGGRGN
jgi:hypothetical protein